MAKTISLTQDGYDQLQKELKELKEVKRPEVISRLKSAKELGDLSENAEYHTAVEDQSLIDRRILEVEDMLKHAKLVTKQTSTGMVGFGSLVTLDVEGDVVTYEIVGASESNLENNKISSESPVGRALMGHKKGDKVTVVAPAGDVVYVITSIK